MHRVVITGLGALTPIGSSPAAVQRSLDAGVSGIGPLNADQQDATLKFRNVAQIADFDTGGLSAGQMQTTERCSQMAILAARQAAAEAGLMEHHAPEEIAVLLGCSTNGRQAEEPETAKLYTRDARVHPLTVPRSMASNGVSQVAIDLGITGPSLTISTACASGAHAIGMAFHMVRSGEVTAALAGAHEAPLTRGFLRAWDSMRVVSPTSCRPFAADRDGMTLAEGAAVLTLETLDAARARGAKIYAEVLGFGMSTDAHHMTQPKPGGPAGAMRAALRDSLAACSTGGQPRPGVDDLLARVAYINAHGTGTQSNDATETRALEAVFGERLAGVPVSSTKGFHGHALGASSAIEAMITALALHHGRLPFTAGTSVQDPALGLNLILNRPLTLVDTTSDALPLELASGLPRHLALSSSLAFGGLNAVLVFASVA